MITLGMLWLPILLASVLVFVAGFIMNMVLPHHRTDFARLPDEDSFRDAVRAQGLGRGQYVFPFASTSAEMKDPAYKAKAQEGPNGLLVAWPNEVGPTAKQLALHFVYVLLVTVFVAYVARVAFPVGTEYILVFRIVATAAFLGYAGSLFLNSIWYGFSWSITWKNAVDGLVYALLTAGVFGSMWPGV